MKIIILFTLAFVLSFIGCNQKDLNEAKKSKFDNINSSVYVVIKDGVPKKSFGKYTLITFDKGAYSFAGGRTGTYEVVENKLILDKLREVYQIDKEFLRGKKRILKRISKTEAIKLSEKSTKFSESGDFSKEPAKHGNLIRYE